MLKLNTNKTIVSLILAGLLALTASHTYAQNTSVAIIDIDRVIALSNEGKKLQERLQSLRDQHNAEVKTMADQATAIRQKATEGGNSLSEDERTKLAREFEDKTIAINRYRDQAQKDMQKIQGEALKEIEAKLEPIIASIRQDRGLSLILGNTPGVVLMFDASINITQEVIDQLNGG